MKMLKTLLLASVLIGTAAAEDLGVPAKVEAAMFGEHRDQATQQRNRFRHPVGTLTFFGLKEDMTVMEIWPSGGWYTQILAPVLRDDGQFIIAEWDAAVEGQPRYRYEVPKGLTEKFEAHPEVYDRVERVAYSPPQSPSLGEANSLDMIVTFRSTHGWINQGIADGVFKEFARVLKPGGILGVVQHRAPDEGGSVEAWAKKGYVRQSAVVEMAKDAGLVLDATSEVNANPADSKDHPEGVWTLPPGYRLGDTDREKYAQIGESDRMTLRFKKPAS